MDEVKGNTSTGRRRGLVALASVVMTMGLLAACGSGDKPANSTPSTPTTVRSSTTVAGATTTAAATATTAAGASTATTAAGASTAPGTTTAATGQYTVAGGDSLFLIAKKYCVSIDTLIAANGWADGIDHVIHPGDVIVIPAGACSASTARAYHGEGRHHEHRQGSNDDDGEGRGHHDDSEALSDMAAGP